ncbi:MAG TPA: CPBP family intramembrane glutamic endopeptidase, partial [Thermoanaerobaculia bacterium]
MHRQRLTRADWLFLGTCALLFAASLFVVLRYFGAAFPEASIDFKHDRDSSRAIAASLLASQQLDVRDMKRASYFDTDDTARIFLERSLGLDEANRVMGKTAHVWYWHHRWFKPLQEEEYAVEIAPEGAIVRFSRRIPEARAMPDPGLAGARAIADGFLIRAGARDLRFLSQSERKLPRRVQRIFTWESASVRPANASYRHVVTVDGNAVSGYSQRLKVPDQWLRSYRELRSKNEAAGSADTVLMIVTMIAIVVMFIIRLRRGDLHLRFMLAVGAISVVLVTAVTLNQLPATLAGYNTTTSYAAFVTGIIVNTVMQTLGTAMLLIVICGTGEVFYRERLPQQLALPRLWTKRALSSKRVFRSFVLGYTLVPLFIAYQVVFYLTARRFGAWSPADVPYSDILNSALPWAAVLFAGFFPAFSEEFLSRAFSIPFFQRFLRWRWLAIVVAAFLWGFGHATYANQPFWIRGVEVGLVGIVAGFVMDRYGLLALLIWHYTIDALYTALLLFSSGNAYYIFSAGLATLIFAVPMIVAIVSYVRNGGFIADDDLTNATLPVHPPPPVVVDTTEAPLPPPLRVTPRALVICVALLAIAALLLANRRPSVNDAIDYRITSAEAKRIAVAHVRDVMKQPIPAIVIAAPSEGFRAWNRDSSRQEGGSTTGFDDVAATYIARRQGVAKTARTFRETLPAGNYAVRMFTPSRKEEYSVDVDPRTSRVILYEKQQDEARRGAQLERDAALAIARRAFATYGVPLASFELREALTFQQPARRDWLFHFEERTPIVADAFRRVSVRVSGDEVTQFAKHVKVPDAVYREAETRTFLDVVALVLKLAAAVVALAIVIVGLITATRRGGLPWRRALKWTLALAIIPVAETIAGYETSLFGYSTSVAWETFRFGLVIDALRNVGLTLGLLFLSLAGIEATAPYLPRIFKRASLARFGRSAVVRALTAIALLVIVLVGIAQLRAATGFVAIHGVAADDEVTQRFPALFGAASALTMAILFTAAAAMYATAVASAKRRWTPAVLTIGLAFALLLDAGNSLRELPLNALEALLVAAALWIIARHILGANPLAWPLA